MLFAQLVFFSTAEEILNEGGNKRCCVFYMYVYMCDIINVRVNVVS